MTLAKSVSDSSYPMPGGYLNGKSISFTRGEKLFELSNHLGNVLATVSDRKLAVQNGTTGLILYYQADVLSANDYYPFEMIMPGRDNQFSTNYRYGINGQEKSNELVKNTSTAEFWQYDSRTARRLNVDPIYKNSSYECFGGNPILFKDPNGLDSIKFISITRTFKNNGYSDRYSDNLVTREFKRVQSSFRIEVVPCPGDDVYIYYKGSIENEGKPIVIPTVLNPNNRNSSAGVTKGKNIYFDGLITTQRDNYDWESVGKFMNLDEGFYNYLIKRHPESASWRSIALTYAAMEEVLPVFTKSVFSSWLGFRYSSISGASAIKSTSALSRNASEYSSLLTPLDELDPAIILYRGTTGTENGSSVLFLTNDANVAASYIKNGGQVMQYEMSQFSLKSLQSTGELLLKTGIHVGENVPSIEYMFTGKNLVESVNALAKPFTHN